ncbi:hypothetical protein ASPBRDRAFT_507332 [Aspergillus brasiliensis CBS 101740]|uniref:Uncharacterized protein n=1 Tax=Aspergillus brasiliensis (strain CBS 101740 / IMI 381727 / IBT 21946) TaxID=767769 RepID=A0A1L9UPH6_ASPBC|nr:hypothetical protein ASPBRDRAFT_507332 [Aspergillus brasiliensis CBS 101740]
MADRSIMNSSINSRPSRDTMRAESPLSLPPAPDALQQSVRSVYPSKPDTDKEELQVQVNTLKYELENFKQERDLMVLRHEKELRDLQLKADSDFRKAQVCPASRPLSRVYFPDHIFVS